MAKALLLILTGAITTYSLRAQGQVLQVENNILAQRGSINEQFKTTSSTQLSYRICNAQNADYQALLKINIIGNGPGQVPANSTIHSATLFLRAQTGGDGLLYRAGETWDSTPTWNEVGDTLTAGSSIGVGLNTGQGFPFDVTSHVQLWANGTSNQGWVIKGSADDCSAATIYNDSAGVNDRPLLTVTYTPPDTTPPRIVDVFVDSSFANDPEYVVPDGSGAQIKTVAVAGVDRIYLGLSENVTNVGNSRFSITSANSGASYSFTAGAGGIGGLPYVVLSLANPLPSDQIIVKAFGLTDSSGNVLDGDWSPKPTSINSTGTDTFPSGDGTGGGDFEFYITVIPADFNHDNVVNSTDESIQTSNFGMASGATHGDGDADGDGDVDGNDFLIWQQQLGTNFTTW